MSLDQFKTLLDHAQLIDDAVLSERAVEDVFFHIQRVLDDDEEAPDGGGILAGGGGSSSPRPSTVDGGTTMAAPLLPNLVPGVTNAQLHPSLLAAASLSSSAGVIPPTVTDKELSQQVSSQEAELTFAEFLEGIVAVAHMRHSDPFTPFPARFLIFLTQHFFIRILRFWEALLKDAPHTDDRHLHLLPPQQLVQVLQKHLFSDVTKSALRRASVFSRSGMAVGGGAGDHRYDDHGGFGGFGGGGGLGGRSTVYGALLSGGIGSSNRGGRRNSMMVRGVMGGGLGRGGAGARAKGAVRAKPLPKR